MSNNNKPHNLRILLRKLRIIISGLVVVIILVGFIFIIFSILGNLLPFVGNNLSQFFSNTISKIQVAISSRNQQQNIQTLQPPQITTTPKSQQTQTPPPQPQKKDLPSIIAKWSPSVALVVCTYSDNSGAFGSGFLTTTTGGTISVLTNKHVITDDYGYNAISCAVEIPGDGSNYYTAYNSLKEINIGSVGDWGYLNIVDGSNHFNSVAKKDLQICQQQEQTGDSVIVLGYPDYAGQFENPTATQGIISGYAYPYYTTSAQIESGNSGGVAIDPDKDCYVGIPSAVKTGNYANLGRILNANIPFVLPY